MSERERTDPELWVDEYGDYLYRYALSRLLNPELAEETVQETFLAALKSVDAFRGQASMKTWLVGILKHKIVDQLRKLGREKPYESPDRLYDSVQGDFNEKGMWEMGPAKWTADPGDIQEKKEFWEVFRNCLGKLSKTHLSAYSLREIEGKETGEICMILDISPTNLWVILYRARMSLRKCLEEHWFKISD